MKYCFLIFLIINTTAVCGQADKTSATQIQGSTLFPEPDTTLIRNPQSLIGYWETMDSAAARIAFSFKRGQLFLSAGNWHSFEFFWTDSCGNIPVTGVEIRWPPSSCRIKQIDDSHLDVVYEIFGAMPELVKYRKVKDRANPLEQPQL